MAAVNRTGMTPPPSPTGNLNPSIRPGVAFTTTDLVMTTPPVVKKPGFNRGVG